MISLDARELFDKTLILEPGKKIVVRLRTSNSLNTLRVLLHRERRKYIENVKGSPEYVDVIINTRTSTKEGIFEVHLCNTKNLIDIVSISDEL